MAWGGTGGGASESAEGAAGEGRGGSSTISETVLGGLATGTAAEEEEEEEDDEEEDGVGLLVESVEGAVRNVGGSRACLGGGGSCWESFAGRGSGAKRTPADSTERETCKHLRRADNKNGNRKCHHHIQ